jgi:hypothetical protein
MGKIIRDESIGGDIVTMALCIEWGVRRCNVAGCTERPNTIIQGMSPKAPLFGLCERHFQEANRPDGARLTLVFDDFDAFVAHIDNVC